MESLQRGLGHARRGGHGIDRGAAQAAGREGAGELDGVELGLSASAKSLMVAVPLRSAAEFSLTTVEGVSERTGASTGCGGCRPDVEKLLLTP